MWQRDPFLFFLQSFFCFEVEGDARFTSFAGSVQSVGGGDDSPKDVYVLGKFWVFLLILFQGKLYIISLRIFFFFSLRDVFLDSSATCGI